MKPSAAFGPTMKSPSAVSNLTAGNAAAFVLSIRNAAPASTSIAARFGNLAEPATRNAPFFTRRVPEIVWLRFETVCVNPS